MEATLDSGGGVDQVPIFGCVVFGTEDDRGSFGVILRSTRSSDHLLDLQDGVDKTLITGTLARTHIQIRQ